MADDNTPKGTVADEPAVVESDADDLLDTYLEDPEEDTDEEGAESGEDAGDEPEDDDSDEEDDASEEDGDQPSGQGRFAADNHKVRLSDGTVVTIADLKQGSLRQADYTRKTQEVARERQTYQERNQRVEQLESQLAQERQFIAQVYQEVAGEAPDPSMMESDPIGYMRAREQYQERQGKLQQLAQQFQQAQTRYTEQTAEQMRELAQQGQQRLLEAVPELRDQKRFAAFRDDALKFGTEVYGFAPEEIGNAVDGRVFHVLRDAIQWRKFQAQKQRAVQKTEGRPPVAPGRRQNPKAQKQSGKDRDRKLLRATGGKGRDGEAAWDRLADDFL